MAASRAAMAAHMKPGEWKAQPECPEQNLLSFDKYCKRFRKFLNITDMAGQREDVIWDMFCMTGGEELEDLLTVQAGVNMVHLEERRANALANPPIAQRDAAPADTWEVGIAKVRAAIDKTITPVMQRLKLWYESPQGDNLDIWLNDLVKQGERINWDDYKMEQAVLDAICFQTTDMKWRHKILSEKLTLQEAIDYGRTSLHTRTKTKKLEDATNGKTQEESLGRVNRGKGAANPCKKCGFDSHMSGKCPAAGKECYRCGGRDHFGHAPACSGKKKTKSDKKQDKKSDKDEKAKKEKKETKKKTKPKK